MPQNFKQYLVDQSREDFLDEQFFGHLFRRALAEAEWSSMELNEGKIVKRSGPIVSYSADDGYDARAAYRHYGTPEEDKDATAKNIADHIKKHGKPPSVSAAKGLKVFRHDTNPATSKGFMGHLREYGPADPEAIPHAERQRRALQNFDEFDKKRKNDREGYDAEVKEAQERHKRAGASLPLQDTTKSETVTKIKGIGGRGKNGHLSAGMQGIPDVQVRTLNAEGDTEEINACHGKSHCVKNCLAKNGCGAFNTTKGRRDNYEQTDYHNAASQRDRDLLMHHQANKMAEQAEREGKDVRFRPDTATGHQAVTHALALSRIGAVDTYGKSIGGENDPHDMTKRINITVSDHGVPVGRATPAQPATKKKEAVPAKGAPGGKAAIDRYTATNAVLRQSGVPTESNQGSRIGFTVYDVNHPKGHLKDPNAKHTNPIQAAKYAKVEGLRTIRRYDVEPSEPKAGEPHEYYDEKTKSGRILHGEKSYYYTDHDVPRPMETVDGGSSPTYEHDNRIGELERHHKENPHGRGINAVAMATTSTNLKRDSAPGESIFHSTDTIDDNHIGHIMHPASIEARNARAVLARSGARSQNVSLS